MQNLSTKYIIISELAYYVLAILGYLILINTQHHKCSVNTKYCCLTISGKELWVDKICTIFNTVIILKANDFKNKTILERY